MVISKVWINSAGLNSAIANLINEQNIYKEEFVKGDTISIKVKRI